MADTTKTETASASTPTPAQVQATYLKLTAVVQDPARRVAPTQSALGTPWLLELHRLLQQIPPEAPEYDKARAMLGSLHWSEAFSLRLTSALAHHDAASLPAPPPPIEVVVNQKIQRDRTARLG